MRFRKFFKKTESERQVMCPHCGEGILIPEYLDLELEKNNLLDYGCDGCVLGRILSKVVQEGRFELAQKITTVVKKDPPQSNVWMEALVW